MSRTKTLEKLVEGGPLVNFQVEVDPIIQARFTLTSAQLIAMNATAGFAAGNGSAEVVIDFSIVE